MQRYLEKTAAFFEVTLDLRSRLIVILSGLVLLPAFFLPLWDVQFESHRYPEGLTLDIYAHRLAGGKESDILEVNALNHYLGMTPISENGFAQFQWFPFILGITIMICFRVAVLGKMSKLVDIFFLYTYSALFALWSFYNTLYSLGHKLNPFATVKIEPFTPPLWGHRTIAEVDVYSNPGSGIVFIIVTPLLLILAMWVARASWVRDHQPQRDYIE